MLRKMSSPVLEARCGDEENEGEAAFVAGLAEALKSKSADHSRLDEGASPAVKNIGKPCAAKPHARFDEGGSVKTATARLSRRRQTKETETDKTNIEPLRPAFYSTRKTPRKLNEGLFPP